jgi:hypothetical protein
MSTPEVEDVPMDKAAPAKKTARRRAAPPAEASAPKASPSGKRTTAPAKAAAPKKAAAKTASVRKRGSLGVQSVPVTPEERWKLIASAAYFKAQARGFAPGGEETDWLEAEREIDAMLG